MQLRRYERERPRSHDENLLTHPVTQEVTQMNHTQTILLQERVKRIEAAIKKTQDVLMRHKNGRLFQYEVRKLNKACQVLEERTPY